jgi:hypothetical protein
MNTFVNTRRLFTRPRNTYKATTDAARDQAEQMIAMAEAESRQIVADAKNRAARELDEANSKLAKLEIERRTVGSYLEHLEKVVEASRKSLD